MAVFNRQLGATRPVASLTETEKVRLHDLVQKHGPRLRKVQCTTLEDKLQVRVSHSIRAVQVLALTQHSVLSPVKLNAIKHPLVKLTACWICNCCHQRSIA